MSSGSYYNTRQRENLLDYLRSTQGSHVTVHDIHSFFLERGAPISVSTIYRLLERMVEAGLVHKHLLDSSSAACFEYVDRQESCQQALCFHCKCEKCGRLIHLKCEEVARLQGHLAQHHGFILNPLRTVFYGVCDGCSGSSSTATNFI